MVSSSEPRCGAAAVTSCNLSDGFYTAYIEKCIRRRFETRGEIVTLYNMLLLRDCSGAVYKLRSPYNASCPTRRRALRLPVIKASDLRSYFTPMIALIKNVQAGRTNASDGMFLHGHFPLMCSAGKAEAAICSDDMLSSGRKGRLFVRLSRLTKALGPSNHSKMTLVSTLNLKEWAMFSLSAFTGQSRFLGLISAKRPDYAIWPRDLTEQVPASPPPTNDHSCCNFDFPASTARFHSCRASPRTIQRGELSCFDGLGYRGSAVYSTSVRTWDGQADLAPLV